MLFCVNSRVFRREHHRADEACVVGPAEAGHDQGEQRPVHAVAQHEIEHHEEREERDDDEGVVDRHQHAVDEAAAIAGDEPDRERQDAADERHRQPEQERVAEREGELPEHVLPARGRAEGMRPGGRHVGRHHVDVERRIGREGRQAGHHGDRPGQDGAQREFAVVAEEVAQHLQHGLTTPARADRAADRACRSGRPPPTPR